MRYQMCIRDSDYPKDFQSAQGLPDDCAACPKLLRQSPLRRKLVAFPEPTLSYKVTDLTYDLQVEFLTLNLFKHGVPPDYLPRKPAAPITSASYNPQLYGDGRLSSIYGTAQLSLIHI